MPCVNAKRLRCSTSADHDNNNNSSSMSSALDDDDLLQEILICLPPHPSSLPCASLVCTRWRNILSDPQFLARFRKHHHKPPLLGFFRTSTRKKHDFVPIMDTEAEHILAERFTVPKSSNWYQNWHFVLGCRHGFAILLNEWLEIIVWDPLTDQQHRVPFSPGIRWAGQAAVLCADANDRHVHGDCFLSPFKLVLMCAEIKQARACLYESKSGVWLNIVSTSTTDTILRMRPSILIGHALYWMFSGGDILAFDTNRQTLLVIEKPPDAQITDHLSFQLLRTNGGSVLGFAVLSKLGINLWQRKTNSEGIFEWVLQPKTIQLDRLFPQRMCSDQIKVMMVGYDEESNVIVLATYIGDFMLHLDSTWFRRISERNCLDLKMHYPYRNFYTRGRGVGRKQVDQKL